MHFHASKVAFRTLRMLEETDRRSLEELQTRTFGAFADTTVYNEQLTDDEMDVLLSHPGTHVVSGEVESRMVCAMMLTEDPSAVRYINAAALAQHFPREMASGTLWYGVAWLLDPAFPSRDLFDRLGHEGVSLVHRRGGEVIVWDTSGQRQRSISRWSERIVNKQFGVDLKTREIDRHVWIASPVPQGRITIDLTDEAIASGSWDDGPRIGGRQAVAPLLHADDGHPGERHSEP